MDKAQQAVARLREGGWTLATAESLTGGDRSNLSSLRILNIASCDEALSWGSTSIMNACMRTMHALRACQSLDFALLMAT